MQGSIVGMMGSHKPADSEEEMFPSEVGNLGADLSTIHVGICVRRIFQNVLKRARIGKNEKDEKLMIPSTSLALRRLGSSKGLPANPQVARLSRVAPALQLFNQHWVSSGVYSKNCRRAECEIGRFYG